MQYLSAAIALLSLAPSALAAPTPDHGTGYTVTSDLATGSDTNQTFSLTSNGTSLTQLTDGQVRIGYADTTCLTLTLSNNLLVDDQNRTCYISAQTQLQCQSDMPAEEYSTTGFTVSNGTLSYSSGPWYACQTGQNGTSNVYSSMIDELACAEVTLELGAARCAPKATCVGNSLPLSQLSDGQFRYDNSSDTSTAVSIINGALYDSQNRTCYVSSQTQLQCEHTLPAEGITTGTFSESDGSLALDGSMEWWACTAEGSSSSIYTTSIDSIACTKVTLPFSCPSNNTTSCEIFSVPNLGQIGDGQVRVGLGASGGNGEFVSNSTFTLSSSTSTLTDSAGRPCYITAETGQLQCDNSTSAPSSRFSVESGSLSVIMAGNRSASGAATTTWWKCETGREGAGANVYVRSQHGACEITELPVVCVE
ncbi:hypothetical protein SAICODRAFT_32058 [Saitoella complicata NRRL Y-17804]|nr:uncharacterized protein SAICODRAFT_32058 [Saitoella complicata NRRL Y-17804]ODQ50329.1 hypothetical protein SAICODRAFT_32058 [Saitoella complicata NRRL Y-17804]